MTQLSLIQISDNLNHEFKGDSRNIVFWYDDKGKLEADTLKVCFLAEISMEKKKAAKKEGIHTVDVKQKKKSILALIQSINPQHGKSKLSRI